MEIQEAIKKYDEYMGDPLIKEVAEEIGTYQDALMRGLVKANAPIYKLMDILDLIKNGTKHINLKYGIIFKA